MKRRSPLITLVLTLGALLVILSLNDALIPNQAGAPAGQRDAPTEPATQPGDDTATGPQFPDEAVYAGKDTTGELAVAVAIKGDRAVGYLCNGKSIEAWLTGTVAGSRVNLEAAAGGSTVDARFNGERVTGVAAKGDEQYAFDLEEADPPAGLYRREDDTSTIGWIVLPDGSQVGIKNTGGTLQPAPKLDPATDDAEAVTGDTR